MGYLGLIPGLGRSPGEGKGYPLQYSDLENSMDYIVHGVADSNTTFTHSLTGSSVDQESAFNLGDLGSILGLERSPGEGKGYPLQYSGLENSMDCIVHEVTKSRVQLRDFHFIFLI